jgi:hypothetical protein
MTLVLLPILFALGNTANDAIDSPCKALTRESCEEAGSGPGGLRGAINRGETRTAVESKVASTWGAQDSTNDPKPVVDCPDISDMPPKAGTTAKCTIKDKTKGDQKVLVTWTSDTEVAIQPA